MNVTAEQLAASRGVSVRTAQRWLRRIQKVSPDLVHERRHRLVADARKIAHWVPPPRRKLIGHDEDARRLAQMADLQRRLDVEVRERLKLADRVALLEKYSRSMGFGSSK